jgi:hypothetical protein
MRHPYRRRPEHRRGPPKPDRRRALELLAASPEGCTEALLFANGFTAEMLIELIRTELATPERMMAGGKQVEITVYGSLTRGGRRLREFARWDKATMRGLATLTGLCRTLAPPPGSLSILAVLPRAVRFKPFSGLTELTREFFHRLFCVLLHA